MVFNGNLSRDDVRIIDLSTFGEKVVQIIIKGSGSNGNSTLIKDLKTGKILVLDAGVKPPKRQDNISGVLITHCHSDHTSSLRQFKGVDIYGTREELGDERLEKALEGNNVHYVNDDLYYDVDGFRFVTLHANHDTLNPVHYIISVNGKIIFYSCDTVDYPNCYNDYFEICDLILVDCNYDEDVMEDSEYDELLKSRIVEHGHASAQYIKERFKHYEHKLVLCHLSQYNNNTSIMDDKFKAAVAIASHDRCPITINL